MKRQIFLHKPIYTIVTINLEYHFISAGGLFISYVCLVFPAIFQKEQNVIVIVIFSRSSRLSELPS